MQDYLKLLLEKIEMPKEYYDYFKGGSIEIRKKKDANKTNIIITLENNINLINGVKECAVVVKKNEDLIVKTIKAFVVGNVSEDYIKEELKKLLPNYMIPKTIKIIDKLPVNQNGKIDRKVLSKL